MSESFFPCSSCGAELSFAPGTTSLKCEHCGAINEIQRRPGSVTEEDYQSALAALSQSADTVDRVEVHCESCGARTQLADNVTAGRCPFCGSRIVAEAKSTKILRPKSLLPFGIDRRTAESAYEKWIASRWFAPSDLKKRAFLDSTLTGIYLPYWTYDCLATTDYTGQRGIDYWTTETYTTTVNGRSVTRTRQVRRTRWYPCAGTVRDTFDDILVPATTSLPDDRLNSLEPWDLPSLVPYQDDFLAGFSSESYAVGLEDGFGRATVRMRPFIERTICADIGGDHQIISSMHSRYSEVTFKHLLLPVWVSAYRYANKTYRIIINARTGELSGERPWSFWKIAFLVLAILGIAGAIALIVAANR